MIVDASYWQSIFTDTFVDELSTWSTAVIERLLPTFDNLEGEAESVSSDEFTRRGRMPASEDSYTDMSDIAESANDEGLAHYERMQGARQGLLNLATAGLYHLFEQQAALFVCKALITRNEEKNRTFMKDLLSPGRLMKEFKERLLTAGINFKELPSYEKVRELGLVANVVKHGGGRSAESLVKLAPNLFAPPMLRDDPWTMRRITRNNDALHPQPPRLVDRPLAGNDLYVTPQEFQMYAGAATALWSELAAEITKPA